MGTEVAAELAEVYPNKVVTVLHSRSEMVAPGMPDNFYKKIQQYMDDFKVKYLSGE